MLEEACKIKVCMDKFKNLLLRILSESGRDKMSTIILVRVLYWQFLHNKFFIKKCVCLGTLLMELPVV